MERTHFWPLEIHRQIVIHIVVYGDELTAPAAEDGRSEKQGHQQVSAAGGPFADALHIGITPYNNSVAIPSPLL